jgi:hypothetical protein
VRRAKKRTRGLMSCISCWRCGTTVRRSILTSRQHLVNEAEHLLCELPLGLRVSSFPTPR